MPEIIFTDTNGESRKALHKALNAFLAPMNVQLPPGSFQASGSGWELSTITHTYHQFLYRLRYSHEELGNRLVACLEHGKQPIPLLLWQYSDFVTDSQGLIFMDRNHEGEWAWEQAHREENFPYLIRTYQELAVEQVPAWERCYRVHQSENLEIRVCRNELDFRVVCGTAQEFDPCISYAISGLPELGGILRTLKQSARANSDLHELVQLGQQCGWVYGWIWGGGGDEYHGTFWARDTELSHQLATASGIRVLGHF